MEPTPQLERRALMVASPRVYREWTAVEESHALLQQQGITIVETLPVHLLDGKPPLATNWEASGVNQVIAAGGDGTIGAVATHIAGSNLSLGILPLGSSNDFARSLHLPLGVREACQTIAEGHLLAVDVGCAQPALSAPYGLRRAQEQHSIPETPEGQRPLHAFFAHALTLGLNVNFARLATSATMRQRFGPLTYPVAALSALSSAQPMKFTLTFQGPACSLTPEESENEIEPDQPHHYEALQVAVINSPLFGGSLSFALAGVEMSDHLLDILIVECFDPRQLLAAARAALKADKRGWREAHSNRFPGIRHVRARQLTIETEEPADVTLDGELRGRTPIVVTSVSRALQVFVPEHTLTAEADDIAEPDEIAALDEAAELMNYEEGK
jgi:diacylglycerol kinase (ATP)